MGGYVSLDDMFFLAMLDDVFFPCLMYIHILPNFCFIFQMLSIATVHVKKNKIKMQKKKTQKKNEVEYMRSWVEDLDWFEDLVDFVSGLLFILNF